MQRYAIVQSGEIVNICVWDGETPFNPGEGLTLVLLSTLPPGADIGWAEQGGQWSPPQG